MYLRWTGGVANGPLPTVGTAKTLAVTTRAGPPRHLQETLIDAVLREIGAPAQDN